MSLQAQYRTQYHNTMPVYNGENGKGTYQWTFSSNKDNNHSTQDGSQTVKIFTQKGDKKQTKPICQGYLMKTI